MKKIIFLYLLISTFIIKNQEEEEENIKYYDKDISKMIKNKDFSINFPLKSLINDSWINSINVKFKDDFIKFNNRKEKYGFFSFLKPIDNDENYEFDMKFSFNYYHDTKNEDEFDVNGFYIKISNDSIKNYEFNEDKFVLNGLIIFFLFNRKYSIISHKFFQKKTIVDKNYMNYLIKNEAKLKSNNCKVKFGSKNLIFLKLVLDFEKNNNLEIYLGNIENEKHEKDLKKIKQCYEASKISNFINKRKNYFQIHSFSGEKLKSDLNIYNMDLYENKSKYQVDEEDKIPKYLIREYIDHIKNLGEQATINKENLNDEFKTADNVKNKILTWLKYSSEIHKGYKIIHEFIYSKLNKISEIYIEDYPILLKIEKIIKNLEQKEATRFKKFQDLKDKLLKDDKLLRVKDNLKNIEKNLSNLHDLLESDKLSKILQNSSKLVNIVSKINIKNIYYKAQKDIKKNANKMKTSMIIFYIFMFIILIVVFILGVKIIKKIKSISGYGIIN